MATGRVILVVDDDAFTAEMTGTMIEEAGYEVMVADGGPDALEKMASNGSIGAVVADLNMTALDGLQLYAEMRRRGHLQPFVLLTAEDAEPLKLAHPYLDGVMCKDDKLQDALPGILRSILRG